MMAISIVSDQPLQKQRERLVYHQIMEPPPKKEEMKSQ